MLKSTSFGKKLNTLLKEIQSIKINPEDTYLDILNKFYDIMKSYSICQGIWSSSNSRTMCNGEWILCYTNFQKYVELEFDKYRLFYNLQKDLSKNQEEININIEDVYNDIIHLEIKENDSFKSTYDKFIEVMLKYNITRYKIINGNQSDNHYWQLFIHFFIYHKIGWLFLSLNFEEPPLDVAAYGKKPLKEEVVN